MVEASWTRETENQHSLKSVAKKEKGTHYIF